MRILICSTAYNSLKNNKIGIFQLDQAKALSKQGNDVRIASIDVRLFIHIRKFYTYSYDYSGIKAATSNSGIGNKVSFSLFKKKCAKCARKAYDEITKDGWKPDIIHSHFFDISSFFSLIARDENIPFVVTEHYSRMHANMISNNDLMLAKTAYSNARLIISVSNSLADAIKKNTGYDSIVVPNIADISVFKPKKKDNNGKFTFITAGRIIPEKGMDIVIKAFSQMDNDNVKLIIMGYGPKKKYLEKLVRNLGVNSKVYFYGRYLREQFNDELNKSDCFILTSKSETFGVVYAEAMLTGTPVIASKCGGPEDFITEKVGKLVEVDNIEETRIAMEEMIQDSSRYNSDTIYESARKLVSHDVIAKKLESIYNQILLSEEEC